MKQRKSDQKARRIVWRMTESNPMGEWLNPYAATAQPDPKELPEVTSGDWMGSSFDLLRGADVSDDPDTVPAALLDELFSSRIAHSSKASQE
jgi:hypothetical protein